MGALAKPQMRGLLHSSIKKNLIVATGLCFISVIAMKVFWCDARKAKYAEFYRTYDMQKDWERMSKTGWFQALK